MTLAKPFQRSQRAFDTSSMQLADEFCKRLNSKLVGNKVHPARFPAELPRFFIQFLTEPENLVLDPFAGSNTTGFVSEELNRRWIGLEIRSDYAVLVHVPTLAAAEEPIPDAGE